jgi:hypothetical protein
MNEPANTRVALHGPRSVSRNRLPGIAPGHRVQHRHGTERAARRRTLRTVALTHRWRERALRSPNRDSAAGPATAAPVGVHRDDER